MQVITIDLKEVFEIIANWKNCHVTLLLFFTSFGKHQMCSPLQDTCNLKKKKKLVQQNKMMMKIAIFVFSAV